MARYLIETVSKIDVYYRYNSIEEWFDKEFDIGIKKTLIKVIPLLDRDAFDIHSIGG